MEFVACLRGFANPLPAGVCRACHVVSPREIAMHGAVPYSNRMGGRSASIACVYPREVAANNFPAGGCSQGDERVRWLAKAVDEGFGGGANHGIVAEIACDRGGVRCCSFRRVSAREPDGGMYDERARDV